MSCYQGYSEIVFQQNHQSLSIVSYTFFDVFGMSRKMEGIRLNRMLIDRRCHQNINSSLPIILQSLFQSIQSSFPCFRSSLSQLHFQFIFRTIQDIQFTILCIIHIVDDSKTCLNIHCLTMIGRHLRRTIYNRCT